METKENKNQKYKPVTEKGECVFCKIAQGEIKPRGEGTIFEDGKFIAWLSPFPNTPGFTVLATKKHYSSDVLALPPAELSEFVVAAKKVAKMLKEYFADVGRVGLIMEGTGINHAHIKLFPMHGTEYMKKGEWKQVPSGNETFFEKYQGYLASNNGPPANLEEIKKMAAEIKKIKNRK